MSQLENTALSGPSRRSFMQAAGVGAAMLGASAVHGAEVKKRRYALIGTGVRGTGMWGKDLVKNYSDVVEFVGLCDINPKRLANAKELIGVNCPTYTDFDQMIKEAKPDTLCITTMDSAHAQYIVKGLELGLDVLTEKPMVIDEDQCRDVLKAEKRTGRKVIVTFNYRYAPKHVKIKELLMSGEIGKVLSVDFHWYLDTSHGADYFRRWHRLRKCSGSLWVHKCTHHFDLMNWWLGAEPVDVSAKGEVKYYGKNGAFRSTHCRACERKSECKFYTDITRNKTNMKLYVEAEGVDGYLRDGCVFREDVDSHDSMNALVNYSNGATMTYSCNAFLPIEGYSLSFNGEKGRLDIRDFERQPWKVEDKCEIYLTKHFSGKREKITYVDRAGGHGGGDPFIKDQIFRNLEVPEYLKLPDSRAGAMSCLTGIAARKSCDKKRIVTIKELLG